MTRARSERGTQLVELAIVTPLLMLVFAGIAESGMFFRCMEVTQSAVREGARISSLPGADLNNYAMVRGRITDYISQARLTGNTVVTATPRPVAIGGGLTANGVQVTVTYTYNCRFLPNVFGLFNGNYTPTFTFQTGALMRTQVAALAP
jgi:Flp pilus assembly protein TadG